MRDEICVRFLQWCLPRLGKRWPGFRKVRGQACKRIARRLRALGLPDVDAYRAYLETHPAEWAVLDDLCRITISRFYRDRGVFDRLRDDVLPGLARAAAARGLAAVRCWSAGCASGEEPYTLRILWEQALRPRFPGLALDVTATDAGAPLLARAARGCYPAGALKELPAAWRAAAFTEEGDALCLRAPYRDGIRWLQQDIRREMPDGPFHLVLCRNLVFTYFDERLQQACLDRILERLHPQGVLVLGRHERLPAAAGMTPLDPEAGLYRKA